VSKKTVADLIIDVQAGLQSGSVAYDANTMD